MVAESLPTKGSFRRCYNLLNKNKVSKYPEGATEMFSGELAALKKKLQ